MIFFYRNSWWNRWERWWVLRLDTQKVWYWL